MLKLSVFSSDINITLGEFIISHVCYFKQNEMSLHFIDRKQQLALIDLLIDKYVTFSNEGSALRINMSQHQRVAFRIDLKS